jgi:hypothetical protein
MQYRFYDVHPGAVECQLRLAAGCAPQYAVTSVTFTRFGSKNTIRSKKMLWPEAVMRAKDLRSFFATEDDCPGTP